MKKIYVLTLDKSVLCISHSLEVIEEYLRIDYEALKPIYDLNMFKYVFDEEFSGFLNYDIHIYSKESCMFTPIEGYKLQVGFLDIVDPEKMRPLF